MSDNTPDAGRYFCEGPRLHFWTSDIATAGEIIRKLDASEPSQKDCWTVTESSAGSPCGDAVAWQWRYRDSDTGEFRSWRKCSRRAFDQAQRGEWGASLYEARALYDHPAPADSEVTP